MLTMLILSWNVPIRVFAIENPVNASASPTTKALPAKEPCAQINVVRQASAFLRIKWPSTLREFIPLLGMLKWKSVVFVTLDVEDLIAP